jgi:hypothetical protein
MAGVYGEIDSRAGFHRVLRGAIDIARRLLAQQPGSPAMQSVEKQLDAMKRWTDGGRDPTPSERRSIDVGLIAARELSGDAGEAGDLRRKLFALNNYFEDWPTDAEAASATDDDFFDDD